jgi:DNA gyrase/topoisomerase IV subunit B
LGTDGKTYAVGLSLGTCSNFMTGKWVMLGRQAAKRITVWNNGDGVPVEMHKEENVYVPELIFGHLLTSSNYNDDEKKVILRLMRVF